MSDKKGSSSKKLGSTCMPEGRTSIIKKPVHGEKLILDEPSIKAKTRTEHYQELSKNDKVKDEEDYYDFSSPIQRGLGLLIDAAFLFGIYKLIWKLSSVEVKVINYFLDKYKLQFMFGEAALLKVVLVASLGFALILAVVIPAAFFNSSLGKKLTKQRIRGDEKYTLSISQAFCRELIWKPLSIACVIGFVLPFFDKKKKSLHDKMSGTFIIRD